jgi:hypothetical protein
MLRGKIVAEVSAKNLGVDELVALTTGGATLEAVS